jgi:hypothetical protein
MCALTKTMASVEDRPAEADHVTPGRYRHYKGGIYEVLGLAQHTETDEWFVLYRAEPPSPYPPTLRLRPLTMFREDVERDGRRIPRFRRLRLSE